MLRSLKFSSYVNLPSANECLSVVTLEGFFEILDFRAWVVFFSSGTC